MGYLRDFLSNLANFWEKKNNKIKKNEKINKNK